MVGPTRLLTSMCRLMLGLALAIFVSLPVRADDWPQWLGPKRDGIWRESGLIKDFPKGGPPVVWRTPVGEGYAGPAVANGRVFVTDWLRAAGTPPQQNAFARGQMPGTERIHCLDEATGKVLWTHEYDCPYRVSYAAGPRCTPLVAGNRVYTLGTMGDLKCLDVNSGKLVWSKNFVADYKARVPVWGFAGHPLLDGDRLVCLVGADDALVVALHKDTGKEIWRSLPTIDADHTCGYCPPMIAEVGGTRQLIVWSPVELASLDPETGKPYWSQPFQLKAGLSIPTPRIDGDRLFVTAFYNGPMMLQLAQEKPAARVLWKGHSNSERKTDGLHAIMCTPFLKDGHIYGVCSYGQLRCLRIATGERLWETFAATGGKEERWANAFIVAHEDRYFLFNEKGDLILANLTPEGYSEISRSRILEPTNKLPGRTVVWMHPAFANRRVYARNDREIVCVSLEAKP